jgi:hypothetical protein
MLNFNQPLFSQMRVAFNCSCLLKRNESMVKLFTAMFFKVVKLQTDH